MEGRPAEGCRVPSVRELAAELQVNPNTMMRAFEELARGGIITNRRGLGYFVAEGAREHITQSRRRDFFTRELPRLFKTMDRLDINIDDICQRYKIRQDM